MAPIPTCHIARPKHWLGMPWLSLSSDFSARLSGVSKDWLQPHRSGSYSTAPQPMPGFSWAGLLCLCWGQGSSRLCSCCPFTLDVLSSSSYLLNKTYSGLEAQVLPLMETLPNSLAHPSGNGGCDGGGDPSRNNDRLLSISCVSQRGVVGSTASPQSAVYRFGSITY